jgi:signal transduction histidine kinase
MASVGRVDSTSTVAPSGARPLGGPAAGLLAAIRAPFRATTLRELLFCLIGLGFGLGVVVVPFGLAGLASVLGPGAVARDGQPMPAAAPGFLIGVPAVMVLLLGSATAVGRGLGAVHRYLAARLLGRTVPPPAPPRFAGGPVARIGTLLRDGAGWRAVAYSVLKLPLAVPEGYGVFCWIVGLVNLSYPFWWGLFRNHPPHVRLDPVAVLTPFGAFRVATFAGTFAAFAAGAAMILAAPWIARGATSLDLALMRGLLGPGGLAQRVQDLEKTRAQAVDETAALLRRLERNLHDGTQMRLAALAMNLGRAKEHLGDRGDPADLAKARELVDAAHRSAKDALVELRDLARGIHPPVLDNGLPDALATLAAGSAIPVRLTTDILVRPSPAIETISYFCAAELLANAAKHSRANTVTVRATQHDGVLRLCVTDDGVGGADPGHGSGLSGLAGRVRTVDGRLDIASPPGGPTRITVELPLRA